MVDGLEVAAVGDRTHGRSHANRSQDRPRHSFFSHYCNARSLVPREDDPLADGEIGNARHILARGSTHLPYAQPSSGTPCAANAGVRSPA